MKLLKEKIIGVLMGGRSAERDISLITGQTVSEHLRTLGINVVELHAKDNTAQVLINANIDILFNALHGRWGEDGCVQGLCEILGLPYTGSDVLSSALAMNKKRAKELFRLHNLPTPPFYACGKAQLENLSDIHGSFGFPVVVKPVGEGSSIGVSLAHNLEELHKAVVSALKLDTRVLVERYIEGMEVCVGIVNGRALGAMRIHSHNHLFDYQAKYTEGYADYEIPAPLEKDRYEIVLAQALAAHQALGCRGATRVDMIVGPLGNEYILEVNTLPGLTPQSLLPRLAAHQKMSYQDLLIEILRDVVEISTVSQDSL